MSVEVGRVAGLWRYPVQSMGQARLGVYGQTAQPGRVAIGDPFSSTTSQPHRHGHAALSFTDPERRGVPASERGRDTVEATLWIVAALELFGAWLPITVIGDDPQTSRRGRSTASC